MQGCTTQISSGPKIFFRHMQEPKSICFYQFRGCFFQANKLNGWNLGFAGHIKSFRGPHLARRPYVVHVWFTASLIGHMQQFLGTPGMLLNFKDQEIQINGTTPCTITRHHGVPRHLCLKKCYSDTTQHSKWSLWFYVTL